MSDKPPRTEQRERTDLWVTGSGIREGLGRGFRVRVCPEAAVGMGAQGWRTDVHVAGSHRWNQEASAAHWGRGELLLRAAWWPASRGKSEPRVGTGEEDTVPFIA